MRAIWLGKKMYFGEKKSPAFPLHAAFCYLRVIVFKDTALTFTTTMISIFIVEDEPIIAMNIQLALEKNGYQIVGMAESAEETLVKLKTTTPDVVLLDINLEGDQDGVVLAQQIHLRWGIPHIFLTSYTDRTTIDRAKGTNPFGYIVKPFNETTLQTTIEIAVERLRGQSNEPAGPAVSTDQMFIRADGSLQKINVPDIAYIEACDNYCYIHRPSERQIVRSTLKQIAAKLPPHQFVRCHRTYLVNIKQVTSISGLMILINAKQIPIGKSYKSSFFTAFQHHLVCSLTFAVTCNF